MGATESKLAYRQNVFRLSQQKVIPLGEESFWSQFFLLSENAEDVFNLLSMKDLRKVRDEAPGNLLTLMKKSMDLIEAAVENQSTLITKENLTRLLNAIRLLTRILPFLFELDQNNVQDPFYNMFWIVDEGVNAGMKLVQNVVKLLFLRGFTLPDIVSDTPGVHYIIWHAGVGSSSTPPDTQPIAMHRTETLRLLLAILSFQMYISPENVIMKENKWFEAITVELERKAKLALFCSLLNAIMDYDPVGWAIPYNHIIFTNTKEHFVSLCIHIMVILVDSGAEVESIQFQQDSQQRSSSLENIRESSNAFKSYLSKIHKKDDLNFILNGINRILRSCVETTSYLPGSVRKGDLHVEILMFLWKLISLNDKFLQHLVESEQILSIMFAIMLFILEARNNTRQSGLARMCIYIIHSLSQHRSFGIQLNSPFNASQWPASSASKLVPTFSNGNWGDFFILSIHLIVTTTARSSMASLHDHLMLAVSNVASYLKSLSSATANKLLSLFNSLSHPAYLFGAESNHRVLIYLFDAINSIIQYQTAGNANLILAIIRNKVKVLEFQKLTFAHAQEEIARLKAAKAQRARASPQTTSAPSSRKNSVSSPNQSQGTLPQPPSGSPADETGEKSNDEPLEMSEKARGKLPATDYSADLPPIPLYDSKGKFIPTLEWFSFWKDRVPIALLIILIDAIASDIENLCLEQEINDDRQVIEYLEGGTLVGLLPAPHPILIRKFAFNDGVRIWFLSFIWGHIYVKELTSVTLAAELAKTCPPIFAGSQVSLFVIK